MKQNLFGSSSSVAGAILLMAGLSLFRLQVWAASLDEEAENVIRQYYASVLTRCGEDYFFHHRRLNGANTLIQLKGLKAQIHQSPLRPEDQRSGNEWVGYGALVGEAMRSYDERAQRWRDWRSPGRLPVGPDIERPDSHYAYGAMGLVKLYVQWVTEYEGLSGSPVKFDCTKVPK